MNATASARQYSLQVKPEADLHGKYMAVLCAKETVDGFPFARECRMDVHPDELQPMLHRLAISEEQITSIISCFSHEQAITITSTIDADLLQREGFQSA